MVLYNYRSESMKPLVKEQTTARLLRKRGYSLKEIADKLDVAESSVSVWVRNVELSPKAIKRLLTKIKLGQFIAAKNKKAKTRKKEKKYLREAKEFISNLKVNKYYAKLLCAAIYWCEGSKKDIYHGVTFTNSDPGLIKTFLLLFRKSFNLDPRRFRPLIHLHSYHSPKIELAFWSKVTNINKEQFTKPYIKPHGGKKIRDDYHGCLSLRYFDADLSRKIIALGKVFTNGGVG